MEHQIKCKKKGEGEFSGMTMYIDITFASLP